MHPALAVETHTEHVFSVVKKPRSGGGSMARCDGDGWMRFARLIGDLGGIHPRWQWNIGWLAPLDASWKGDGQNIRGGTLGSQSNLDIPALGSRLNGGLVQGSFQILFDRREAVIWDAKSRDADASEQSSDAETKADFGERKAP